jgi:hypothetical protein
MAMRCCMAVVLVAALVPAMPETTQATHASDSAVSRPNLEHMGHEGRPDLSAEAFEAPRHWQGGEAHPDTELMRQVSAALESLERLRISKDAFNSVLSTFSDALCRLCDEALVMTAKAAGGLAAGGPGNTGTATSPPSPAGASDPSGSASNTPPIHLDVQQRKHTNTVALRLAAVRAGARLASPNTDDGTQSLMQATNASERKQQVLPMGPPQSASQVALELLRDTVSGLKRAAAALGGAVVSPLRALWLYTAHAAHGACSAVVRIAPASWHGLKGSVTLDPGSLTKSAHRTAGDVILHAPNTGLQLLDEHCGGAVDIPCSSGGGAPHVHAHPAPPEDAQMPPETLQQLAESAHMLSKCAAALLTEVVRELHGERWTAHGVATNMAAAPERSASARAAGHGACHPEAFAADMAKSAAAKGCAVLRAVDHTAAGVARAAMDVADTTAAQSSAASEEIERAATAVRGRVMHRALGAAQASGSIAKDAGIAALDAQRKIADGTRSTMHAAADSAVSALSSTKRAASAAASGAADAAARVDEATHAAVRGAAAAAKASGKAAAGLAHDTAASAMHRASDTTRLAADGAQRAASAVAGAVSDALAGAERAASAAGHGAVSTAADMSAAGLQYAGDALEAGADAAHGAADRLRPSMR